MGNLIKAEFRKVVTTHLWWALLIPTAAVGILYALVTGAIGEGIQDAFSRAPDIQQQLNADTSEWKWSAFGFARSINIATIMPMVFGALAISGEYSQRTITSTFLTAPNRAAALGAKMITYVVWGALYGVVTVASVSIGLAISADSLRLPDVGEWLAMSGVGILACVLMTLFGIGIGALIRNVAGTVIVLVFYFLLVENGLELIMMDDVPKLIGALPNGSINGLTGSVAADIFLSDESSVSSYAESTFRWIAGAPGAFAWWVSGLIFLGWTALAFGGGWLASQKRDIT